MHKMGNLIFDGKGIIGHDLIVKMKRSIEMLLQGFPPITANGTAKESITALTVYGHSTQDDTPSPENPIPIVSAGSVMTTGKNVLPPETGAEVHMNIPAGTKCFLVTDGTPSNGGNVFLYDAEGNINYLAIDAGATEEAGSHGVAYNVDIVRFVNRLVPGVNTAMYIGEKLPYEPYTGGIPGVNPHEGEINVTVSDGGTQSQTLAISTPGGLPGIPVDSGGNYTDENGQQWVCDEVDFARGVYVQRLNKKILTSALPWKFSLTVGNGNNNFQIRLTSEESATDILDGKPTNSMCNFLKYATVIWDDNEINLPKIYAIKLGITASFPPDSEVNSLQKWNELLDGIGNCYIYYILDIPIETPLSAEQISAYKALHTYSPTTTVGNDAEAWMKVGVIME